MPTVDDQVTALAFAFAEMAKMLAKSQHLKVLQLATAIDNAAKNQNPAFSPGTHESLAELARRLRQP